MEIKDFFVVSNLTTCIFGTTAHCENLTNFFHFLGPEFLQPEMTFENHRFAKLNETIES